MLDHNSSSYIQTIHHSAILCLEINVLRGHENDRSVACQTDGAYSGMTAIPL